MSQSPFKTKEFKALAKEWNQRLVDDGHNEIEEYGKSLHTPYLKDYHSVKFQKKRVSIARMQAALTYTLIAEQILTSYSFKNDIHRQIWKMHTDGLSVRKIALAVNKNKDSYVMKVIKEIRKEIPTYGR